MNPKIAKFPPKQPVFEDLSKMVPTPGNIQINNPDLRKKMLANHLAEIANHNTQLQDQIMAMQVRIASNNLVIEAIQNMAKTEGVQMSFNFEGPPAADEAPADHAIPEDFAPVELPVDPLPLAEEANENTPVPEVPPTQ